jgi:hypothetical protein
MATNAQCFEDKDAPARGARASAITQLAAALTGCGRSRSAAISLSGFFFPYSVGFPVLAYPGRKPLPPVFGTRPRPF